MTGPRRRRAADLSFQLEYEHDVEQKTRPVKRPASSANKFYLARTREGIPQASQEFFVNLLGWKRPDWEIEQNQSFLSSAAIDTTPTARPSAISGSRRGAASALKGKRRRITPISAEREEGREEMAGAGVLKIRSVEHRPVPSRLGLRARYAVRKAVITIPKISTMLGHTEEGDELDW